MAGIRRLKKSESVRWITVGRADMQARSVLHLCIPVTVPEDMQIGRMIDCLESRSMAKDQYILYLAFRCIQKLDSRLCRLICFSMMRRLGWIV